MDERINLLDRRQQPGQIERQATNQRKAVCFRRWLDVSPFQFGEYKMIDLIPQPTPIFNNWQGLRFDWLIGPVRILFG